MKIGFASHGLMVDPVLGWAARLVDADPEGVRRPEIEGQSRPSRACEPNELNTEGEKT
jgi:hypothetical protein